jgi:hypothetical protein
MAVPPFPIHLLAALRDSLTLLIVILILSLVYSFLLWVLSTFSPKGFIILITILVLILIFKRERGRIATLICLWRWWRLREIRRTFSKFLMLWPIFRSEGWWIHISTYFKLCIRLNQHRCLRLLRHQFIFAPPTTRFIQRLRHLLI